MEADVCRAAMAEVLERSALTVLVGTLAMLPFAMFMARRQRRSWTREIGSRPHGGCVSPRAPQKPTDPNTETPADD